MLIINREPGQGDQHPYIQLDLNSRKFIGLEGYVVSVVGDNKSQILTFSSPKEYDGIDLQNAYCILSYHTSWKAPKKLTESITLTNQLEYILTEDFKFINSVQVEGQEIKGWAYDKEIKTLTFLSPPTITGNAEVTGGGEDVNSSGEIFLTPEIEESSIKYKWTLTTLQTYKPGLCFFTITFVIPSNNFLNRTNGAQPSIDDVEGLLFNNEDADYRLSMLGTHFEVKNSCVRNGSNVVIENPILQQIYALINTKQDKEVPQKIQDFAYTLEYNTLDYEKGLKFLLEKFSPSYAACSSVRKGNFYGRNYDWTYNNDASFVIKRKATQGKFANIGIASGLIKEELANSGKYDELYTYVPFLMQDGINENGVVCNINLLPKNDKKSETNNTNPGGRTVPILGLIRWILDEAVSADDAINKIKYEYNLIGATREDLNYEYHFMIADSEHTYVVEFVDNAPVIIESFVDDKPIMTNFYLDGFNIVDGHKQGLTLHANGIERYDILSNGYAEANTQEDMLDLMQLVKYTKTYETTTNPFWYSEYYGIYPDGTDLNINSTPEQCAEKVTEKIDEYHNRTRENPVTWQSVHSIVYDIESKNMLVLFQEDTNVHKFVLFGESTDDAKKLINEHNNSPEAHEDIRNLIKNPDWNQNNTTAKDYIKNKPNVEKSSVADAGVVIKRTDNRKNTAGNSSFIAGAWNKNDAGYVLGGGWGNQIHAEKSLVEGSYNIINDSDEGADIIVGRDNEANDGSSSVFGEDNIANSKKSTVLNSNNISNGDNQVIIGQNNAPDEDMAFIVGDGEENRSNSFSIGKDGTIYIGGTLEDDQLESQIETIDLTNYEVDTDLSLSKGNGEVVVNQDGEQRVAHITATTNAGGARPQLDIRNSNDELIYVEEGQEFAIKAKLKLSDEGDADQHICMWIALIPENKIGSPFTTGAEKDTYRIFEITPNNPVGTSVKFFTLTNDWTEYGSIVKSTKSGYIRFGFAKQGPNVPNCNFLVKDILYSTDAISVYNYKRVITQVNPYKRIDITSSSPVTNNESKLDNKYVTEQYFDSSRWDLGYNFFANYGIVSDSGSKYWVWNDGMQLISLPKGKYRISFSIEITPHEMYHPFINFKLGVPSFSDQGYPISLIKDFGQWQFIHGDSYVSIFSEKVDIEVTDSSFVAFEIIEADWSNGYFCFYNLKIESLSNKEIEKPIYSLDNIQSTPERLSQWLDGNTITFRDNTTFVLTEDNFISTEDEAYVSDKVLDTVYEQSIRNAIPDLSSKKWICVSKRNDPLYSKRIWKYDASTDTLIETPLNMDNMQNSIVFDDDYNLLMCLVTRIDPEYMNGLLHHGIYATEEVKSIGYKKFTPTPLDDTCANEEDINELFKESDE